MSDTNVLPSNREEIYVRYQCSCTTPDEISSLQLPSRFPRRPLKSSAMVTSLTQTLERLYLCEKCQLVKCHRCIKEDVMFHFCPHCQFEVQGAINLADKMKCWRNCLLCPECSSNLTLMEELASGSSPSSDKLKGKGVDVVSEPFMISTDSGGEPATRQFHYFCFVCKYDSREQGLLFDKTLFLAGVVADMEKAQSMALSELNNLQIHYDVEYMVPHFVSSNAALRGIESLEGFDIRLEDLFDLRGRTYQSQLEEKFKQDPDLKEILRAKEKEKIHQALTLTEISEAPSLHTVLSRGTNIKNPMTQLGFPQRQPLRSRRIKSCLTCQTVLSRPSPKVNHSHRFAFKCPSINYVPSVTFFELPALVAGKPLTVGLRFTNPLYYKVFIQLYSPLAPNWFVPFESNQPEDVSSSPIPGGLNSNPNLRFPSEFNHHLELPTPKFSVEAYREGWEFEENQDLKDIYDDVEDFDLEGDEEEQAAMADSAAHSGLLHANQDALRFDPANPYKAVVDRHLNTTAILVAVTPRGESGTEVILPILMTYTTRLLIGPTETVAGVDNSDRPVSPLSVTEKHQHSKSASATLPDQSSGRITTSDSGREYHTRYNWIYIKLGNII